MDPLVLFDLAIVLVILLVVVAVVRAAVAHAERRGWIRGRGTGRDGRARKAAAAGIGLMEEVFAPARHHAHQQVEECERVEERAPAPGDWLDDTTAVTGRFDGTVSFRRP